MIRTDRGEPICFTDLRFHLKALYSVHYFIFCFQRTHRVENEGSWVTKIRKIFIKLFRWIMHFGSQVFVIVALTAPGEHQFQGTTLVATKLCLGLFYRSFSLLLKVALKDCETRSHAFQATVLMHKIQLLTSNI